MAPYLVQNFYDLDGSAELKTSPGPANKGRSDRTMSQYSLIDLLTINGTASRSSYAEKPPSSKAMQVVSQRELYAQSDPSGRKSRLQAKAKHDPLCSSSDHVPSKDAGEITSLAHGSCGDLSRPLVRASSSWKLMSLRRKAHDPLSLSSVSDHVRRSKTSSPKALTKFATVEPSRHVIPPRPIKSVDSLSRVSEQGRSIPSKSSGPKKTPPSWERSSVSDHGPANRGYKSVSAIPSLAPHVAASASQSNSTRRVRFNVDEIDYFEYEGATAEERVIYVTTKADSKRGKKQAIAEGKALAERDPAWVKAVETLFESPLKRRSSHSDASELTKDQAIRLLIESDSRGLENKSTPLMQRHCRWAIATVLSRQGQLDPSTPEERAEELRTRLKIVSRCSADFARVLGRVDAEAARAIRAEGSPVIARGERQESSGLIAS